MKPTFTRLLVTVVLALIVNTNKLSGQSLTLALNNPVIMQYYTVEQLQELAVNDTNQLNAIVYYFTASFVVTPIDCFDCLPFDSAMFDITRYEHLRLQDTSYTREFTKYGFRVTLLSINELPYEYAIHSIPRLDTGETKQPE